MAKIQINQQQTSIGIGEGMLSYPNQGTPGPSGTSVLIGNIASTMSSLGDTAFKYGQQQQERKNISETTKAQVNFLTQLDNINTNYQTNTQFNDFESYTSGAKQQFDDLLNDTALGITNPKARENFVNQMRLSKEALYMSGIAENGRRLNEKAFSTEYKEASIGVNALLQNPNSLFTIEEAFMGLEEKTEQLRKLHPGIPDELVEKHLKEEKLSYILSYSQGQIEKDPIAFKAMLLGDYNSFINKLHDIDYSSLDTKLTKEEEIKFQEWKKKYAPNDSGYDYDLRGAFKAGLTPDKETGHWNDEFKKPNHQTFSDQSKFAKDEKYAKYAGTWEDEKYNLNPGVLEEFFSSEYAPAFAKELSEEVRQKLVDQADIKINKLKAEAEKVNKERLLIMEDTIKRTNEAHLLGLETEGKSDYSIKYIPKILNNPTYIMEQNYNNIEQVAIDVGVDRNLLLAILQQESGARHIDENGKVVTSPAGAIGIGQLMPATAKGLKVDPYDEKQNLLGAAKYLKQQLSTFGGDVNKALAAYNAGPNAVKKYNGIPPYKETQNYIKSVSALYNKNKEKYGNLPIATSQVQEDIYNVTLAKDGYGKAVIALREQQEKETKAVLTHTVLTSISPLTSEMELLNYKKQFNDAIAELPASPQKLLYLEKKKVLDTAIKNKINELKIDPAAYADKYSNTVRLAKDENKFTERAKFQIANGIPDGAVKVLTNQEANLYALNIAKQESVQVRIAYIVDLEKTVGSKNYRSAIAQIASVDSSLDKPYWVIPQLNKTSPTAANALTRVLKDWDNTKLNSALQEKNIDKDILNVAIYSEMKSLLSDNLRNLDPKAYQMFRDTAQYLGKYYAATLNTYDTELIAKQVKKDLISSTYTTIDLGPGNAEDILISKELLKEPTFNVDNLKTSLKYYLEEPFTKDNIILSDDYIINDLALNKNTYEKSREYYKKDFINRVNKNIDLIPTISGLGAYVVYINPNTKQKLPLKNKNNKPIYIDFKNFMPYANEMEQSRAVSTGLLGEYDKARNKLRQRIYDMRLQ